MDDGVIKFSQDWRKGDANLKHFLKLQVWRKRLYKKGLVGAYDDGTGFGNISRRNDDGTFTITGTQTGGLETLLPDHYATVSSFDIKGNTLKSRGQMSVSSESLTHAAVYDTDPSAQAVVHVHNAEIWERLAHQVPTSRVEVPYGTVEMAEEIVRLFQETDLLEKKILVMAGHEDGIITFGRNLDEAGKVLLSYLSPY